VQPGTHDSSAIRNELLDSVAEGVEEAVALANNGTDLRTLEDFVARSMLEQARLQLAHLFAILCCRKTEESLQKSGLRLCDVRFRLDADYWITVHTTLGPVTFPLFAYRLSVLGANVTRAPARELFPYHKKCRSSPLCLEWETRLGALHPFRRAPQELTFFSRDAVTLEDNTIATHLVAIGAIIGREWLYRSPKEIREILRNRASLDKVTGEPIVSASCDAHALPRYVDETWNVAGKMAHGIRIWCEDRHTGEVIHLGGEFTWGDCRAVGEAFRDLIGRGILPANGDYGYGVKSRLVWVSDAMRWFNDHILTLLPWATVILDVHHLLRWFAVYAQAAFGAGKKLARQLYARVMRMLGFRRHEAKTPKRRKGHKKTPRTSRTHAHDNPDRLGDIKSGQDLVQRLLDLLSEFSERTDNAAEELDALVNRLCDNVLRMDYAQYLARGYQIGSGAMESLHRTGSQQRLKVPGARWLANTAQSVFNVRMLGLVGKWDDFWSQPDLMGKLTEAFSARAKIISHFRREPS
jgi:hypothetical protein